MIFWIGQLELVSDDNGWWMNLNERLGCGDWLGHGDGGKRTKAEGWR
jgi:hypothetical protein